MIVWTRLGSGFLKNKDRYDMRKLKVKISYHIDGCGKKIESYRFITIEHEGQIILDQKKTKLQPIEFLFGWLEGE